MHAVIITRDLGTRCRAMTADRMPTGLLPIAGVPIIFRQLRVLRREGITHVTVLSGRLGDQLAGPLGEETRALGLALELRVENEPLGAAACLSDLALASEGALLVYGDL